MDKIEIKPEETGPVEETNVEQTEVSERPDWLDQKFKSPQDLQNAYNELQSKLGQQSSETPTESTEASEPPANIVANDTFFDQYREEFTQNGQLTDESIQDIVMKKGIPEALVRQYIDGFQAVQERETTATYNLVGGKENYEQMIQWAGANWNEAQITEFNNNVQSGDRAKIDFAMTTLNSAYSLGNNVKGKMIKGETASISTTAFTHLDQFKAAVKDPRYKTDASYRQEVEERLKISNIM
jgi:hypothetical protein